MADKRGELKVGEPHPAIEIALRYYNAISYQRTNELLEVFSSCAIENNRLAEICVETISGLKPYYQIAFLTIPRI